MPWSVGEGGPTELPALDLRGPDSSTSQLYAAHNMYVRSLDDKASFFQTFGLPVYLPARPLLHSGPRTVFAGLAPGVMIILLFFFFFLFFLFFYSFDTSSLRL